MALVAMALDQTPTAARMARPDSVFLQVRQNVYAEDRRVVVFSWLGIFAVFVALVRLANHNQHGGYLPRLGSSVMFNR